MSEALGASVGYRHKWSDLGPHRAPAWSFPTLLPRISHVICGRKNTRVFLAGVSDEISGTQIRACYHLHRQTGRPPWVMSTEG